MEQKEKPSFSVLPVDKDTDFDALVALFTTVKGRPPTEQELAEARAIFEED